MKLPAAGPRGSRPFDFVAVGESSLDLLCGCSALPEPDSKAQLLRRLSLPGGQAATAAVGVARLGFQTRYLGAVGDDAAGQTVLDALRQESVDVSSVVVRHGTETRSAVIIVDESGRRCVLGSRDERLDILGVEIAAEVFTSGRVLLVDGSDLNLSRRAASTARAAGVRTMVDVDAASDGALELLRQIDAVIVPVAFVHTATGCAEVGAALEALARKSGAAVIVATAGEDGAMAWSPAGVIEVSAEPVRVVDTTGAGDAFRAGFAAAWLGAGAAGPDLSYLLRFAARVAAMTCREYGAQRGLPTAAEMGLTGEGLV